MSHAEETVMNLRQVLPCVALLLALPLQANAFQVTLPYTFQPNTPAKAEEVNGDLAALKAAIDAQQQTIASLQSQLAAVKNNTVLQLDGKLGLGTDAATGQPTARFTAVNVQIVNGTDSTETANGLGNLIIGYNESAPSYIATKFCSDGSYNNQTDCQNNSGTWAANQRNGSHNLIVGNGNAYSQYGGLVAGHYNVINGKFASVSGGQFSIASGFYSSVSGGNANTASGEGASVSGGGGNTASASDSSVSGGGLNVANGSGSSVSGGAQRSAAESDSWAAGTYSSGH
jgi:hypothetical protein